MFQHLCSFLDICSRLEEQRLIAGSGCEDAESTRTKTSSVVWKVDTAELINLTKHKHTEKTLKFTHTHTQNHFILKHYLWRKGKNVNVKKKVSFIKEQKN